MIKYYVARKEDKTKELIGTITSEGIAFKFEELLAEMYKDSERFVVTKKEPYKKEERLSFCKTDEQYLKELREAVREFSFREYQDDTEQFFDLDDIVQIAFTDEVYDSEDKYDYEIQCSIDLKNKLDIYEMYNEHICVKVCVECSYEGMISNLEAESDDWVACINGIDYDEVSLIIDRHKKGENLEELLDLADKGIYIELY